MCREPVLHPGILDSGVRWDESSLRIKMFFYICKSRVNFFPPDAWPHVSNSLPSSLSHSFGLLNRCIRYSALKDFLISLRVCLSELPGS